MTKIFLDPGHGGKTVGTSGGGVVEKHLNLEVALTLQKLLENEGIDVVMARTSDTYSSLQDRTNLAAKERCDLYISIHHNGAENKDARGITVYHQLFNDESKNLARAVLRNLVDKLGLSSRGLKTRQNSAGNDYYHVLRENKMPAILSEAGFLTNPEEAAIIKNKKYGSRSFAEQEAHALLQGVLDFLGREAAKRPFPDVPPDHWAADAISEMKGAGVFIGLSDGTFSGGDYVTRYELAVTLRRLANWLRR